MAEPRVEIACDGDVALVERMAGELRGGGVFVVGCQLALFTDCTLVLRGGGQEEACAARVVWGDGVRGVGLELIGFGAERRARVEALLVAARQTAPAADADADADADAAAPDDDGAPDADDEAPEGEARRALHLHERLRNLSLVEQIKLAQGGETHVRVLLERMYGKTVWEPLLRNPRLTAPEITRIARMAALPRVLLEVIVGNGGWLQIPEVRRALLTNPRLGPEQIPRVLRQLPRHELKLVPSQTAYSAAVREVARRMLRDD
jgi:hypothetical protein